MTDEELQTDDGTIFEFLSGEKSFNGMWFGERYPGKAPFWWRAHLREGVTAAIAQERAQIVAWLQSLARPGWGAPDAFAAMIERGDHLSLARAESPPSLDVEVEK